MQNKHRNRWSVPSSFFGIALAASRVLAGVDAGPVVNPANNHTYYLLPTSNWGIAERKAISLGGHLVTINDAAENTFVVNQFSTAGGVNRSLWTGLNDAATEGTFLWASGEASTPAFNATMFATGQPDDANGNEDYVHIVGPNWVGSTQIGKWNDAPNIYAFNILAQGAGRAYGAIYGVVEVNSPVTPTLGPITASATWGGNVDGFWNDTTKWAGGLVPDGIGATANLKRAVTGTGRIVYLNTPQTLGTLITGDTDGTVTTNWTITGTQTLTLANVAGTQPELRGEVPTTNIEAELVGAQGFRKTGTGITILWDANPNLSGPINVEAGQLRAVLPKSLGTDAGEVHVSAGAALGFYPQFAATIGDRITLNGDGISADVSGALRLTALTSQESATLTIPEIVLESSSKISVEDDSTGRIVAQKLSGAGNLVKSEQGVLELSSPDNSLFTGKVRFAPWSTRPNIVAGEIIVASERSMGPNPAAFSVNQVLFDYGGIIETTTTQTFSDSNRGFVVGDGSAPTGQIDGGGFWPTSGTVLTVANQIAGVGELRKLGAGELVLTGSLSNFSGRVTGVSGQLTAISPLQINQLDIQAGARVKLQGPGTAGFAGWQIRSLTISPPSGSTASGKLDVAAAGVRIDYDPLVDSPEDTVRTMLADGRILTSSTVVGARVGYGEASELGITSFLGVPVDASTVVLLRTLGGDADLNGIVGFSDLVRLAQHYGQAGKWTTGDFNYDGTTNFADLVLLAQNYGGGAASITLPPGASGQFAADWALAQSLVPEPTTVFVLAAAVPLVRRRR